MRGAAAASPVKAERKPPWLKVSAPGGENYLRLKDQLRARGLHTVCEEARCPNVGECWGGGTATFMLLGDVCTRGCRFCAVATGNPRGVVDREEPERLAETVATLGLRYVVLTSVNRDDLPDGGADVIARSVEALKRLDGDLLVEVLTPDFLGNADAIDRVAESGADVLAHNLETVRRLQGGVRDRRASYEQSLAVLSRYAARAPRASAPRAFVKSSIMLGLGEEGSEVEVSMRDLRDAGVSLLTLGQYLQPSPRHLPVARYILPGEFESWARLGRSMGFQYVAAGPLVRSSYRAGEFFVQEVLRGTTTDERGD
ncbi:MAG: lipoyl synthase [Planctomycetes bacterium]|nr:lipoyl synthase [Planctomycetota bacterium]